MTIKERMKVRGRIFKILEKEPIRLVDGRYKKGFVNKDVLIEMIRNKDVAVVKKEGMRFIYKRGSECGRRQKSI